MKRPISLIDLMDKLPEPTESTKKFLQKYVQPVRFPPLKKPRHYRPQTAAWMRYYYMKQRARGWNVERY